MFRGQFLHSIDQKGRVSMPSRFRDELQSYGDQRVVVAPWPFEPCLHLYPLKAWEEFEAQIAAKSRLDRHITWFRRQYVSRGLDMDVDGSGRVRIAPEFRKHAQLTNEVYWVGMQKYVELWTQPLFDAQDELTDEQKSEYRDKLEELIPI